MTIEKRMAQFNEQIGAMQLDVRGNHKWHTTEKRTVLQFPVPRDVARIRLVNALRSTVYDNSGWLWPRVKYSGNISGDVISIVYSYVGGKSLTKYALNGRLLDIDGGSQIVLAVRDNFAWRLLLVPFFAAIPVIASVYRLDPEKPILIAAAAAAWCLLTTLGLVLLVALSTWERNSALDDVSRYLSQSVLRPDGDLMRPR